MSKAVYLVDVSSLFFRAFYAVRPLTTPEGLPVNAIYGFLTMILKLLREEKVENIVFCYDRKEPSFRKDIFPDYKANRSEMPEDLQKQMPIILGLAAKLGIPEITRLGFEADDLIGSLTKLAQRKGLEVVIVSGDKDFAQLLQPGVTLFDTKEGTRIDREQAKLKWGIWPEQMIDYLALVGDSSDNVPGVRGIGPKTAVQLLENYQSLKGVFENLEQIKGAVATKLKEHQQLAWLSQKLVTIVTDIEGLEDNFSWQWQEPRWDELFLLMKELNFTSLKTQIEKWREQRTASSPTETTVSPKAQAPRAQGFLLEVSVPEWMQLWKQDQQVPVWIAKHPGGWVLGHLPSQRWALVSSVTEVQELFKEANVTSFCGFDLKSLWHDLKLQCEVVGSWDCLLACYVLRAGEPWDWPRAYGFLTGEVLPEFLTPQELLNALYEAKHWSEAKLLTQQRVFCELEMPLVSILYEMECAGIQIDAEELQRQSEEVGQVIRKTESRIHELAGQVFNILSPKQLGKVLFEDLGLPTVRKTKTGFSTDEETLRELEKQHPIAEQIIEYRELSKLRSTYLDALPKLADANGRIHTTFEQAVTSTGRLSSVAPNLQNIPIRTERGAKVRRAFVAQQGAALLSLDYSQIELRILAHISNDPGLIEAFHAGVDIHTRTAAEVFEVDLAQVTADQRRTAKAINFGIAYGQGAFGLSQVLGIERSTAQQIIDRYFARFQNVQAYIEQTIVKAAELGYVETLFGRRRYLPELQSQNQNIRRAGERAAINAPVQGSAADVIKAAMVRMPRFAGVKMILQIHDELIFEGPEASLRQALPAITQAMQEVYPMQVPLVVNAGIGKSWAANK